MKKLTAAILALILVLSLCACNSTKSTNTNNETQKPETSTTKPEQSDNTPNAKTYTIADEVIVDNENCTFKIVKAEVDKLWGFKLKTYCENKTSDKALMFSIDDVSVNGFMIDPFWAKGVAPGMKCYSGISFSTSDFEENSITEVENIEYTVRAYDSDNWLSDDIYNNTLTYLPQ